MVLAEDPTHSNKMVDAYSRATHTVEDESSQKNALCAGSGRLFDHGSWLSTTKGRQTATKLADA